MPLYKNEFINNCPSIVTTPSELTVNIGIPEISFTERISPISESFIENS